MWQEHCSGRVVSFRMGNTHNLPGDHPGVPKFLGGRPSGTARLPQKRVDTRSLPGDHPVGGCPKLGGCGRKILTESQLRPPSREACLYDVERVCVHFPYKNVFLKKCFRRTNIILRILSKSTSGGYMRRKSESLPNEKVPKAPE